MGITENFLVNTNNFDPIIEALCKQNEAPEKVNDVLFTSLGFENPSDLLVIHLFKGLNIIENDGTPTELYHKMINPKTCHEAIAEGIFHGYRELIEKKPTVLSKKPEELQDDFADIFQGKKTELIVKYMANTFYKLVTYAGTATVQKIRDKKAGNGSDGTDVEMVLETNMNGTSTTPSSFIKKEIMGDTSFEDLVGLPGNSLKSHDKEIYEEETIDFPVDIRNDTETGPEADTEAKGESNTDGEDETEADLPAAVKNNEHEGDNVEQTSKTTTADNELLSSANMKIKQAYIKKSDLLYKLNRYEEVLPALDGVIAHFENAKESFLREAVSNAIIRKAVVLGKLDRSEELEPALDEIINRFEHSDNDEYYRQASMAMLQKVELVGINKTEPDHLPLLQKITNRLASSEDPKIKPHVDEIFLRKIDLLMISADNEEVLKAIDQVIERFENTEESKHHLEEVMYKKAELLEKSGRDEEALEAYSAFLERFGKEMTA